MNSCEIVTLVSTLAVAISQSYPPEEIPLIITILSQLRETLLTILAHDELCELKAEEKKKEANPKEEANVKEELNPVEELNPLAGINPLVDLNPFEGFDFERFNPEDFIS